MTSQPSTAVLSIPCAGAYLIDSQNSTITFTSRHMFGLGTVRAGFSILSGQLGIGQSLDQCRASASIGAASFSSDNEKRDLDVQGPGLLDVARFPQIEFTSTGVRHGGGGVVLVGTVAMHGLVAPVQVRVYFWEARTSDQIHVLARAEHLDRFAFGVTGSRGWVGRYFDLAFDVVAVLTAPGAETDTQKSP